jgi:thioredoxin 1
LYDIYFQNNFRKKGDSMGAEGKLVELSDDNFEAEILKSEIPALVDFWAPWCGPCRIVGPIVEELASEYDGKVNVGKLNVDDNPVTPGKYGVRGIPTLIVFREGEVVDQVVGAVAKSNIEAMLKKAL